MNTEVEKLADAVAERVTSVSSVPLNRAWWSARQIATYLDVSPKFVTDKLSNRPGFPDGKRIPTPKGLGRLRWPAEEVIRWWEKQG